MAHIPSSAQAAMSRHMEQRVPAHLQKYVGNNAPSYIPQRAQAELTSFMQKSMPSHLQQYAGAYVQQKVVDPTIGRPHGVREVKTPPPSPRIGNQSRSGFVPGEQPNAQYLNMFQPDAAPGQAARPMVVTPGTNLSQNSQQPAQPQPGGTVTPQPMNPNPAPASQPSSPYEFIMNPEKPKKKPAGAPGSNSVLLRIAIVGGGLVLLLVIFLVGSSLLSAGSKEKTVNLLSVAQEQTELLRIATDGTAHATTIPGQNLAQDIEAAITSDNGALLTYMKSNGQKASTAQLSLKHSKTDDTALQTAQENNTYDSAFTTIVQSDLTVYMASLQKAFKTNPGPKGKTLLSQQYNSADTLLKLSKQ